MILDFQVGTAYREDTLMGSREDLSGLSRSARESMRNTSSTTRRSLEREGDMLTRLRAARVEVVRESKRQRSRQAKLLLSCIQQLECGLLSCRLGLGNIDCFDRFALSKVVLEGYFDADATALEVLARDEVRVGDRIDNEFTVNKIGVCDGVDGEFTGDEVIVVVLRVCTSVTIGV